jgi:hypothetical protein
VESEIDTSGWKAVGSLGRRLGAAAANNALSAIVPLPSFAREGVESVITAGVDAVFSMVGLSRPPDNSVPTAVLARPNDDMVVGDTSYHVYELGELSDSFVPDVSQVVSRAGDEMAFKSLLAVPVLFARKAISATSTTPAPFILNIFNSDCTQASPLIILGTPAQALASRFDFCCGALEFLILWSVPSTISTKFKLEWRPDGVTSPATDPASIESLIVDVNATTATVFRVGTTSSRYMSRNLPTLATHGALIVTQTVGARYPDVATPNIEYLIYVRAAADFDLRGFNRVIPILRAPAGANSGVRTELDIRELFETPAHDFGGVRPIYPGDTILPRGFESVRQLIKLWQVMGIVYPNGGAIANGATFYLVTSTSDSFISFSKNDPGDEIENTVTELGWWESFFTTYRGGVNIRVSYPGNANLTTSPTNSKVWSIASAGMLSSAGVSTTGFTQLDKSNDASRDYTAVHLPYYSLDPFAIIAHTGVDSAWAGINSLVVTHTGYDYQLNYWIAGADDLSFAGLSPGRSIDMSDRDIITVDTLLTAQDTVGVPRLRLEPGRRPRTPQDRSTHRGRNADATPPQPSNGTATNRPAAQLVPTGAGSAAANGRAAGGAWTFDVPNSAGHLALHNAVRKA